MTAFYSSEEEIAANALQICADLRTQHLPTMFGGLVRECRNYPARMAQVLMGLAIWVDYEAPISELQARTQAVIDARAAEYADPDSPLYYIPMAGEV